MEHFDHFQKQFQPYLCACSKIMPLHINITIFSILFHFCKKRHKNRLLFLQEIFIRTKVSFNEIEFLGEWNIFDVPTLLEILFVPSPFTNIYIRRFQKYFMGFKKQYFEKLSQINWGFFIYIYIYIKQISYYKLWWAGRKIFHNSWYWLIFREIFFY